MRSYQIVEFEKPLEANDYPTPEPQGAEVVVRIHACGVCHSDLHIWQGYFDLGDGNRVTYKDRGTALPFTMGHEIVGEVVAVGPEAEGAAVGDQRVVYPWIGCGECSVCKAGEELLCAKARSIGARVDGGYSDHVVVPHARYLIDYEGIDRNLACTYACSGLTAYSALRKLKHLGADDTLMIIGAGGVGLNAVQVAASVTDARIIVADLDPTKRDAALKAGAADVVDNGADDAAKVVRQLSDGGVAGAIDFVGNPASAQFGIDSLRRGGTLVIVGLYGGALSMSLPMFPFMMRRVVGSYVGSLEEMHELMALVKAGKIPPIPVEARPMEKINEALNDLKSGNIVGRIVLNP